MQAKVIHTSVLNHIEHKINNWLEENPNIEVKFVTQGASQDAKPEVVVVIWYESKIVDTKN